VRQAWGWEGFERHVQFELGLDSTIASGSQFHDKGDAVDRRHPSATDYALQIECKFTVGRTFTLNAKKLSAWVKGARLSGRNFGLAVRFWPTNGLGPEDYILVPLGEYKELLDRYRQAKEAVDYGG
jgi:hypothetical protein